VHRPRGWTLKVHVKKTLQGRTRTHDTTCAFRGWEYGAEMPRRGRTSGWERNVTLFASYFGELDQLSQSWPGTWCGDDGSLSARSKNGPGEPLCLIDTRLMGTGSRLSRGGRRSREGHHRVVAVRLRRLGGRVSVFAVESSRSMKREDLSAACKRRGGGGGGGGGGWVLGGAAAAHRFL